MTIDTILSDLDDTLLGEEGALTPYTLQVMRECLAKGIRIIPASGRAKASMRPIVNQLGTGLPYIAANGAQVVQADHSLMDELLLPAQVAHQVCAYLLEEGCYGQVYRGDEYYISEENEISRTYRKSTGVQGTVVGDLLLYLTFDTPKLLFVNHPEEIARLYPMVMERFGNQVSFTISKPHFLEAAPPGATKGAAIKRLAQHFAIDPAKTLAFGDSLNDISLLAFTPNSVAMGNAREELKQVAAYSCLPNTQDGVARFVAERVLV